MTWLFNIGNLLIIKHAIYYTIFISNLILRKDHNELNGYTSLYIIRFLPFGRLGTAYNFWNGKIP